jgi:hypothetical protein
MRWVARWRIRSKGTNRSRDYGGQRKVNDQGEFKWDVKGIG